MLTPLLAASDGIDWNVILLKDPVIPFVFMLLIGGGIGGGYLWLKSKTLRLKEKMVDRGFSPQEIEQIMQAGESKRVEEPAVQEGGVGG